MTMALVKNNEVVEVGLPQELRSVGLSRLKAMGWKVVAGTVPKESPDPGYMWVYGEPWALDGEFVVGVFTQVQQPQPYPSWTFEEGTGWVPPVPRPDGDGYEWDEDAQSWYQLESEQ